MTLKGFRKWFPRHPLSAAEANRQARAVEELDRAGGVDMRTQRDASGARAHLQLPITLRSFWAKLLSVEATGHAIPQYGWTALREDDAGVLVAGPDEISGTPTQNWAYDVQGRGDLPTDGSFVVRMHFHANGENFWFDSTALAT